MKRLICGILALMSFLSAALCETALEAEEKSVYAALEMDETLASLTQKYGEGIPDGEYLIFGDALCAFYEKSGRLRAKSLIYDDIREVAALAQADFSLVRDFKQGRELQDLIDILDDGTEVLVMKLSDEDKAGTRKLICWKNESGGVLEALFELDSGKWILFALAEVKE